MTPGGCHLDGSEMDSLEPEVQRQIKKCSSDRLRFLLARAGIDPEEIAKMDRRQLLDAVVATWEGKPIFEQLVESSDFETETGLLVSKNKDYEFSLRERDIQLRQLDYQERLKEKAERALFEEQRRLFETQKFEREMAMRQSEIQRLTTRDAEIARRHESTQSRLKDVLEALKHALPKQGDLPDISLWYDNLEKILRLYGVEQDLWSKIVLPLLTNKARAAISRMPLSDLEDYEAVKKFLLLEFKQTPLFFKAKFDNATKLSDESHVVLAGRLRSMLNYYVQSRNVHTFDGLLDLIVCDKLKTVLKTDVLDHIVTVEGCKTLTSNEIASLSDVYVASRPEPKKTTASSACASVSVENKAQRPTSDGNANAANQNQSSSAKGNQWMPKRQARKGDKPTFYVKRCHNCRSDQHLLKDCPFKTNRNAAVKPANVNRVSHAEADCDDLPQFVGCESVKADVHAGKHSA